LRRGSRVGPTPRPSTRPAFAAVTEALPTDTPSGAEAKIGEASDAVFGPGAPPRTQRICIGLGGLPPLLSRGLRYVLGHEAGLHVVSVDLDLDVAALELELAVNALDVVILDEDTASRPGLLTRLFAVRQTVGVLVLAHRPTRALTMGLSALGVSTCLPDDASAAQVVSAVRSATEGRHARASGDGAASQGERSGLLSLTVRERGVLTLLGAGCSNAEIALELQVSVETARTHVAHIYRKLGVRSRGELLGVRSLDGDALHVEDEASRPSMLASSSSQTSPRVGVTMSADQGNGVHTA
jgi:DNA-binding NarL/FixJ family response regulator